MFWEINAKLDVLAEKIDKGFQALPDSIAHVMVATLWPIVEALGTMSPELGEYLKEGAPLMRPLVLQVGSEGKNDPLATLRSNELKPQWTNPIEKTTKAPLVKGETLKACEVKPNSVRLQANHLQ